MEGVFNQASGLFETSVKGSGRIELSADVVPVISPALSADGLIFIKIEAQEDI